LIEETVSYPGKNITESLLGVFERFPDEDGFDVFWSILHALESREGYEKSLVVSVKRNPHEMSVLMLNRILNADVFKIGNESIIDILSMISKSSVVSNEIKEQAIEFIEYQKGI